MYKSTLILDVDGVLRNIVDVTLAIYKRDFDPESTVTHSGMKTWSMEDACPKVKDFGSTFFGKGSYSKEIFNTAKVYEKDISETITKLSNKFNIHILTYQRKETEYITLNWLRKNGIAFDYITFSENKTTTRGDFLVEDKTQNLISVRNHCREIVTFAYDQPWNKDWDGNRIKSLKEFSERYG